MRTFLLLVLAVVMALAFQTVYQATWPDAADQAYASPSLSGAKPAYIFNGDFSGEGLGEVGTPPTNYDFETAGGSVGSPPPNHGFETGDFTDWTVSGSPTVQSGGPSGYYAQLSASGQAITSDPFTVDADAQQLTFDIQQHGSGTFQVRIRIYHGTGYGTTTTKYFTSCPTTCTSWNTYSLDATPWAGQSIKVEVSRYLGNLNVDSVGIGKVALPSWTAQDATKVSVESGGPTGSYARASTKIVSESFTVHNDAQNGEVDLRVEGGSGTYDIYVLSGSTFGTATKVFSGNAADSGTWGTRSFGLGSWAGEDIKLDIRPGSSTTLNIDGAGVARNVLGGWSSSTVSPFTVSSDAGFKYLANVDDVASASLDLPWSCWPAGVAGCSSEFVTVRMVYRMKSNYNPQGTDLGSTLQVRYGGYVVESKGGSSTAGDPVNVWLTTEFRVFNSSSLSLPSEFSVKGWGPTSGPCIPECGGKPDVASLEIVGSGSNKRTFANPSVAARNITPPGFQTPPQTTESDDPVEVVSGNYYHSKTDLALPGPGIPLSWTRSYSAMGTNNSPGVLGPMGPKWSHNWQATLREMTTDDVAINLPMGSTLLFRYSGGTYTPEAGLEATLVKNGGGDWTLTTKSQLVYSFDADGLWTEVEDRNGNSTTLTYNGSDQLIGITDAVSRSLTISYNGDDLIESVEDPAGRTVYYDYDTDGLLIEVTDVLGETVTFDYQGYLLTEATDAKGNLFVRNTYDSFGRVIEQLDADNGLTEFQYATPGDGANRIIDQRGKQTTYYFDQQMRVTDIEDHAGAVTSFVYDVDGNRTSVTNALNKTWTYTYDSDGNVLTATDPLSKTWTYTYNGFNDVLTVTDPLSRVTEFTYDGNGNLTTIEDANGKMTTLTINGLGLVTEIEDPLTNTVTFDYDAYGNRTEVTNALAKTWLYTYDSAGRVTAVEDPLAHETTLTYNAANLVLSVEDELGNTTSYTYDKNGNVLTVTDANLNVTTYVYDNRDQLVSITDAESQVWTFDYDELGNLVEKTNPRGKSSVYTYDDLNRLLTETDPLSKVRSYEYDLAGRLIGRTDPKSQEIVYTYNDRNELTNIAYPDLSFVSFQYNDAGARTQMVDATGTTTYSYDNLYRLTGVTYPGSRTVSYGYDDAGRRTSITYPGGSDQVLYGYDAASRLTTVTDWDSNVTSYSYDDAGRMNLVELPNGVETSYTYDDGDRLTDIEHMLGLNTLAFVNYTLDNVGNRTQRVDGQGTHVYAYDDVYRLTSVTYPGPSTTSYVYDAFGNRTSMTVGANTTTYAYDDNDRITSVTPPSASPIAYAWDDNGNLEDRGSDEFIWDYEDRLVETTVNSVTTEFAYRGDGLRDSRTVGMNTTTFTWDIAAGIPVVLDDGNRYIYGAHGLIAQVEGSDWYYFLSDGLGSTMAITDDVGTVVRDYTYDVFGEVTGGSGTVDSEFQFAGEQVDGSTGLQYLRARYYDMQSGTFISRDPMASDPEWRANSLSYVDNDPVNATDPLGLWCWKFWNCPDEEKEQASYCPVSWIAYTCPVSPETHVLQFNDCVTNCAEYVVQLVGEYLGYKVVAGTTFHGLQRLREGKWTAKEFARTKAGVRFRQDDGSTVYVRQTGRDKFDFVIENAKGEVVTAHKGFHMKALERLAQNHSWTWIP